jgi:hypothetical protein
VLSPVSLHGIATTQLELGYSNPLTQSPLVWRMFKAVKRLQGAKVVHKRLPITVSILSQIDSFFDAKHELDLCMRAAMWLGTCGLLRAGEFVTKPTTKYSLKLQHLTFHDVNNNILDPHNLKHNEIPHYMSLRLDQSKTDPFRQGTSVIISNTRAIDYMLAYLHCRNQRLSRQPLFAGVDGQALTAGALVKFTQSLIQRANIPNAHLFLGHSFRKGGATSLHEAGYPDSLIKIMGRWSSFAFATYIDTPLRMIIAHESGHKSFFFLGCKQLTINYLNKLQDIFDLLPHVYLLWIRLTIQTNPQLDTNKIHFPQHNCALYSSSYKLCCHQCLYLTK